MHIIAATFLLPVGVVMYTFVGGIKATFLTDYFHTFVITVVICFFTIKVWLTPEISSPGALFNVITQLAVERPVSGNHGGSYLTMTSPDVRYICPCLGILFTNCGARLSTLALFISWPTLASSSWTLASSQRPSVPLRTQ